MTTDKDIMKYLLMAVATVVLFTGCVSNSGDAGDETYQSGSNPNAPNRPQMQKSSNNLREGWNH
jgi:PBP1b-binding outer membrane lipoprotein LpoB